MNLIIYGFEYKDNGVIDLFVKEEDEDVVIIYKDDGCGLNVG